MLKIVLIAVAAVAFLTNDSVPATPADERSAPLLNGKAAFGDWQEDEPGVRRLLTLQDQPLAAQTPQNLPTWFRSRPVPTRACQQAFP
jgi:hypothetical protein